MAIKKIKSDAPDLDGRIVNTETGEFAVFNVRFTSWNNGTYQTRHVGWKKDLYREGLMKEAKVELLPLKWCDPAVSET